VWNSVLKCSYANYTIVTRGRGGGGMIWMSSTMDGNRQKGKWLDIKCRVLKRIKANSAPPKGSPWQVSMANGMTMTSPSWLWWL
jgi:hypothetical protein